MADSLCTQNPHWGFFGTIRHHGDPDEAWPLALSAVARATAASELAVRDFLDSRHGRHFADDVADALFAGHQLKDAVDAAAARWMKWTITPKTSHTTGIPVGLPYLTGFVLACEIEADEYEALASEH
jgi:hypothetical protein